MDQMPPFLEWWKEANCEMQRLGHQEINFGEARYWFESNHSPDTAARLIVQDLEASP